MEGAVRISELIKKLEVLRNFYGDLEVVIEYDGTPRNSIDPPRPMFMSNMFDSVIVLNGEEKI